MLDQMKCSRTFECGICPEWQRMGQDRSFRAKSVRANDPIKPNKMKGAFSLNNLLPGTVRPPEGFSSGTLRRFARISPFARILRIDSRASGHLSTGFSRGLEVQQRYFSYRAVPVPIVSRNSFVLVFFEVSHNYRAIRCKMGYRADVPVWN